ncbi:hypothetical protein E2542_SST30404 [Spatholobus suberectus]|nr:hypothetical protein E2542_SST30404 [Spatholobus suberectus]
MPLVERLFRSFFYDDDVLDIEGSDSSVLFSVADGVAIVTERNRLVAVTEETGVAATIPASGFPSEVITHDQWIHLKPEPKSMLSSWVKSAFRSGKKDMQESVNQNLDFVLSSAPIWDRVELKGNKYVLGSSWNLRANKKMLRL